MTELISVSYTHLDVYKRQHTHTHERWNDYLVKYYGSRKWTSFGEKLQEDNTKGDNRLMRNEMYC